MFYIHVDTEYYEEDCTRYFRVIKDKGNTASYLKGFHALVLEILTHTHACESVITMRI